MRNNFGKKTILHNNVAISSGGGVVDGPLILFNNPVGLMDAATKEYTDSIYIRLNADSLKTGVLSEHNIPFFTGDAINTTSSLILSLISRGIPPGDYAKIIVNAKGIVTGIDTLVPADIPTVDFSLLINKPTTLDGYGITDCINTNNSTVTGYITVTQPTLSEHIGTKQYTDTALKRSYINTGDIITKPYTKTPPGYLRCNGSSVDKTIYGDLYSVIMDTYSSNTLPGSGIPWRYQYSINNTQSGNLTNWKTEVSFPVPIQLALSIVTKTRVYILGGNNGPLVNTIYYAPINPDGTLGSWVLDTNVLPVAIDRSIAVVNKNKAYILGGLSAGGLLTTTYSATINSDGSLGVFVAGTAISATTANQAFIIKDKLYVTSNNNAYVYVSTIAQDGTLGTFLSAYTLPDIIGAAQVCVVGNRVYIIGGWNGAAYLSSIYYFPINPDGTLGPIVTYPTSLPILIANAASYVTKNTIYIIGGDNAGGRLNTVYYANINSDYSLGSWVKGSVIPSNLVFSSLVSTGTNLYLICGNNGVGAVSTVYSTQILGNNNVNNLIPGSGKPWQQQYQINKNQISNITGWVVNPGVPSLPVTLGYSQAVVTKNRVYLLGGLTGTGTSVAISNIYTAPINYDGTLGVWTLDTSHLPMPLAYSQSIVTKNRVYLIGGFTGNAWLSSTFTAPINPDGTIGTWVTGTTLPIAVGYSKALITNNRVYVLGGYTGTTWLSSIFTAPINADGTIGVWSTSGITIPNTLGNSEIIVTNNKVHLLGGYTGVDYTNAIYTAPIYADGTLGAFVANGTLPTPSMAISQVIVTANTAYILGCFSNGYTANTYSAPINPDGSLGNWTATSPLPGILTSSQAIVTKTRIYLLGGETSNNNTTSIIYTAAILDGLNDYSPYYNIVGTNLFTLPDFTNKETNGLNYFIKY